MADSCQAAAMTQSVQLPLWLLILILAFAAVTFASHFLFPSVRWFFRRRMERVVARLNERLERPIEPFKLLRRHDMIQRLIYDPGVIEAVAEHARATGTPEEVVFQRARRYAREIVPSFSATLYFGVAIRMARLLSRAFYRVRLGHADEAALRGISPDATVVFVMNHRSNMDYVLVTYLIAERAALSYAVGEWARVWPLSWLIRAMGAYFIRRRSDDALYRRVLARYVRMATAAGVAQAVFPEGGLSLDGRVGAPKLGVISYILSAFEEGRGRDVVFVPVALNYDRVLEDRMLLAAGRRGKRRFRPRWRSALRYLARHLWLRLRGRFLRYGHAAVNFGRPLSLSEFAGSGGGALTAGRLGQELMARIRAVMPVLPVPLVAECLLAAEGPLRRDEVIARVRARRCPPPQGEGVCFGAPPPRGEVEVAIGHLLMRRLVREGPEGLRVVEEERPLLGYYAASIACCGGDAR